MTDTEAPTPAKATRKRAPRKPKDQPPPEMPPWQLEALNLIADVHSHVSVGELGMAWEAYEKLGEFISGTHTSPTTEIPYFVAVTWRERGRNRGQVVEETAKSRAIACSLAIIHTQDQHGIENRTQLAARVVPPGTVVEDEAAADPNAA